MFGAAVTGDDTAPGITAHRQHCPARFLGQYGRSGDANGVARGICSGRLSVVSALGSLRDPAAPGNHVSPSIAATPRAAVVGVSSAAVDQVLGSGVSAYRLLLWGGAG